MSGVIIIGAGHGGSQLAVSLRDEGYEGRVVLVDAEDALPYHRPPLSKTFIKSATVQPQPLRAAKVYEDKRIERIVAHASGFDPVARRVTLSGGDTLDYDELVLAAGARNRGLPQFDGAANVFSLRSLGDAEALRAALPGAEDIVIVGGGFIGLETAAALASIGHRVTVIEAALRVLARVASPEVSGFITAALEASGVTLLTDAVVSAAKHEAGSVVSIETADRTLPCALVLLAIGADPETTLATRAGLKAQHGIVLDAELRTGIPGLWALGDSVRFHHWLTGAEERIESVQNATDQARHIAKSIATGLHTPYRKVPWFWSDIGSDKLQIAGLSRTATRRAVKSEDGRLAVYHLEGDRLVAAETLNWAAEHMQARRHIEQGTAPAPEQVSTQASG
jgi:3-phenylpropionate/trans-cinnamate dioxygenase ferredoxin reductase component